MKALLLWSLLFAVAGCGDRTSAKREDPSRLEIVSGPQGQFIVDATGRSLYTFSGDAAGQSACLTNCASVWPPAIVNRIPQSDPAIDASKLAMIPRGNGTSQLTYAGMPLYYSESDRKPGDTFGHVAMSFGGRFALVSPAGKPLLDPR
jgi:predicted lipoprotein with Yx(FWY)xxD motif